jgi:plastocyanin
MPMLECLPRDPDLTPLLAIAAAVLVSAGVLAAAMFAIHAGSMGGGMMGGGMMGGPAGDASSVPVNTTSVEMRSSLFQPSTINVRVGSTVTWTNADPYAHTVTSDGAGGPLDSPLIAGAGSWTYTFASPGTYSFHCTPHSARDASGNFQGMVGRAVVA